MNSPLRRLSVVMLVMFFALMGSATYVQFVQADSLNADARNVRTLYQDWESVARTAVAQLRIEAAKYPDDPRLMALVGELSVQDAQFARWWAARNVASLSTGTKTLVHPIAGKLVLDWDTLAETSDAEQQLVVWTAAEDSPTRKALLSLASWSDPSIARR